MTTNLTAAYSKIASLDAALAAFARQNGNLVTQQDVAGGACHWQGAYMVCDGDIWRPVDIVVFALLVSQAYVEFGFSDADETEVETTHYYLTDIGCRWAGIAE